MADSLTDSVARLYRAGSEYSQQTQKLRIAVDELIKWLMENIPTGFQLPLGCQVYPSGEFTRSGLSNPPNLGTTVILWKMTRGTEHTMINLNNFSFLIAEGFVEKLIERLNGETQRYQKTMNDLTVLTSLRRLESEHGTD